MKNVRFLMLFMLFISVSLFHGCSEDDNPSDPGGGTPGQNEVLLQGQAFSPSSKTVAVGTTIKWINRDAVIHTVTSGTPNSPSGLFDSGNLGNNAEFSFTFTEAGTFTYYCRPHSNMTGTIIVQ
jgi:plastocyanin